MRSVKEANVKGKVVLVRVDFNVPLKDGKVIDDSRIRAALPTVRFLLKRARKVVLLSHLGAPDGRVVGSLRMDPVARSLSRLLHRKVVKLDDCVGERGEILASKEKVVLLENVRFHPGEEKNDAKFAGALAEQADVFVNDAFGACHRDHASIVGVPRFLPSYAGFLLEKEVKVLSELMSPKRPFVVVLGGAKVSTKIGLIENLVKRADAILVGGAMMFTFYKSLGYEVGKSKVELDKVSIAKKLLQSGKIVLPVDVVCDDKKVYGWKDISKMRAGLDIGPETIIIFTRIISEAKTIFWNGPMGLFEKVPFDKGTRAVALAVSKNRGFTVVGGGDTVAAVDKFKISGFAHVSTGGGASLEFLEGRGLPGIAALENV